MFKGNIMKSLIIGLSSLCLLSACSQANVDTKVVEKAAETVTETVTKTASTAKADGFQYMLMDKFNQDMASFVGLVPGESFAASEAKINAVFKAYDGHAEPINIAMDKSEVEAGWKQVLVTQDGLMDGTVTGQQLLAIFDSEGNFISAGMRIKCHSESNSSGWQNTTC